MTFREKPATDDRSRRSNRVVAALGLFLMTALTAVAVFFGVAAAQSGEDPSPVACGETSKDPGSRSPNPADWSPDGRLDPCLIPPKLALGVTKEYADSGMGWVDSSALYPFGAESRQDTGPYDVYAEKEGGRVIGWYYRNAWVVPVGTSEADAYKIAESQGHGPVDTLDEPEAPPR